MKKIKETLQLTANDVKDAMGKTFPETIFSFAGSAVPMVLIKTGKLPDPLPKAEDIAGAVSLTFMAGSHKISLILGDVLKALDITKVEGLTLDFGGMTITTNPNSYKFSLALPKA